MQPLKITIHGDYWDIQIYRNRLYLWSFDGAILIVDWKKLINGIVKEESLVQASEYGFVFGSRLYEFANNFSNNEFQESLLIQLKKLSEKQLELELSDLEESLIGKEANPFDELPIDSEISSNKLYCSTDSGFWVTEAHKDVNETFKISRSPKKLWEESLTSIEANRYGQFALSAGSEGLFQYASNFEKKFSKENLTKIENNLFRISEKHSSFSNWSFISICSSSVAEDSYLTVFNWLNTPYERFNDEHKMKFEKEISLNSELNSNQNQDKKIFWGARDKIYSAHSGVIDIYEFDNYAPLKGKNYLTKLNSIPLQAWKGKVIQGNVSHFGAIAETDNALVVIGSDKSTFTVEGPITRWRIYPRSKYYLNHLHVILEDRVEIYSFFQDSFLFSQSQKEFGYKYDEKEFEKDFV